MAYKGDVYILRGMPGQGKSTFAQTLAKLHKNQLQHTREVTPDPVICSADQFMVNKQGEYEYDKDRLYECHKKAQEKFQQALRDEIPCVIVDNTNIRHKDYAFYKDKGIDYGYKVTILTVGTLDIETSRARGTHNVPEAKLESMSKNWQP